MYQRLSGQWREAPDPSAKRGDAQNIAAMNARGKPRFHELRVGALIYAKS
jgi:hypothetical protein